MSQHVAVGQDLRRFTARQNAALEEHTHFGRPFVSEVDLVSGQDDRRACGSQRVEYLAKGTHTTWIEPGSRLVEQENGRCLDEESG